MCGGATISIPATSGIVGSIPACAGEPSVHSRSKPLPGVYPRVCGGAAAAATFALRHVGLSPRVAGEPNTQPRTPCLLGVYPRVCGGAPVAGSFNSSRKGLSPRVRGSRKSLHQIRCMHRVYPQRVRGSLYPAPPAPPSPGSIPACAGEPRTPSRTPTVTRVYPRVCGGAPKQPCETKDQWGLSPRVRGSHTVRSPGRNGSGSIPACAGEPTCSAVAAGARRVYPRVCAGEPGSQCATATRRGVYPRVCGGALATSQHPPAHDGSIPACAGEPCPPRSWTPIRRVYPRVCGGAGCGTLGANEVLGLSPRVRGSLFATSRVPTPYGSIPACAGEPGIRGGGRATDGVYPRVCGGARMWSRVAPVSGGLSPRVRGSPPSEGPPGRPTGSIPACAGEPLRSEPNPAERWVYPRVCGGAASILNRIHAVSPGSIPACAGEPADFA